MEGHCSTGQNPQWAVVPTEEEKEEKEVVMYAFHCKILEMSKDTSGVNIGQH